MGQALKSSRQLRVHQALHGYLDGHRLLACSTSLPPRDEKLSLVLSDISGPGATVQPSGYLTGYPLLDSGWYALARTWPAPEMPRSGCVWTHTFFIDFAELAIIKSPYQVIHAFVRPVHNHLAQGIYDQPRTIELTGSSLSNRHIESVDELLMGVLTALYEHPGEKVVSSDNLNPDLRETLALSIWAQQWPRLRRSFRFCTLSYADRSTESTVFDLQFLPAKSSISSRFMPSIDAVQMRPSVNAWVKVALHDIATGTRGDLRDFFHRTGGDVPGGRNAFIPLCEIYASLSFRDSSFGIDKAVEIVEAFPPDTAQSVRGEVASAAAKVFTDLGERSQDFVLRNLDLLEGQLLEESAYQVGRAIWKRNPSKLLGLFVDGKAGGHLASKTLSNLSTDDVVHALAKNPTLAAVIVRYRPDLLSVPDFWMQDTLSHEDVILPLLASASGIDRIVAAMMQAGKANRLIPIAKKAVGGAALLRAVLSTIEKHDGHLQSAGEWLAAATREANRVAEELASGKLSLFCLWILARSTDPDFVPNDYGRDPWFQAITTSEGSLAGEKRQYLFAYVLARALGYRSRSQAELIAESFDEIYFPALKSSLSSDAWALVAMRLPSSWFWPGWDNCRRIREAVADAFLGRNLGPLQFVHITKDPKVFADLVETVAPKWGGRAFLEKVRNELDADGGRVSREKLKQIERYL
jgi:hypothetical protein